MALFVGDMGGFALAYFTFGFQELVPASQLSTVGWISILSAIIYMSWMAIFYANIMSMRSELEREGERHAATAIRLVRAKELADRANRGKSIIPRQTSHDLRTPLHA